MDVRLERLGKAAFAVIGADGATNFGIVRGEDGSALLIDADIRRIDEIEEALRWAECRGVKYLFITHENFDHASANDYFEKKGAVVIASQGCLDALGRRRCQIRRNGAGRRSCLSVLPVSR
jgi:glyoxylase-like metal-dependent hydrolase (beta-lactamase superfamily II)